MKIDELLHAKVGLATVEDGDRDLLDGLFGVLQNSHVDFTQFFRKLAKLQLDQPEHDQPLRDLVLHRDEFDAWAARYRERLRREHSVDSVRKAAMNRVNPKYVLRNYLAQQVIDRAEAGDVAGISELLDVMRRPYDEQPGRERFAALPPDWASGLEVSCSS